MLTFSMPCRKLSALSTGVAVSSLRQLSDGTGTSTLSPICIKQPVLSCLSLSSVSTSEHCGSFSDGMLLPADSSTYVGGFIPNMHMICAQWHRRTYRGVPGCLSVQLLLAKLCLAWRQPGVSFFDELGAARGQLGYSGQRQLQFQSAHQFYGFKAGGLSA